MNSLHKSQAGFTLVELLVVVGIIVVLAATIVPAVAQFAGSGEDAAKAQERDNIQTAIDTWMASEAIRAGDVDEPDNSENIFVGTATIDLSAYLRSTTTAYYYCWDNTGLVTAQHEDSDTC